MPGRFAAAAADVESGTGLARDLSAMPPVGVLPVWADLKEFRSCHIVIYQHGCEVKFCDHGLCVASAEMPTVDAALMLAESRRPNSGPAPH